MRHIFIEVTDLVEYLARNYAPSGIQRVQMDIIHAASLLHDDNYHAHYVYFWGRGIKLLDPELLLKYIDTADRKNRIEALPNLIEKAAPISATQILKSEVGQQHKSVLFITGAPWNRVDYSHFINLFKNAIQARVIQLVHDLIPLKHPEYFEENLVKSFDDYFSSSSQYIDKFLAVSEKTKNDFKHILKYAKNKPRFGLLRNQHKPLGKLDKPVTEPSEILNPDQVKNYVLFVSTIEKRKNHQFLARVWKKLLETQNDCPELYCVGKLGWKSEDFFSFVSGNPTLAKKIKLLTDVSDKKLDELYRNAKLVVYPALEEGFGLPVSEALSYGKVCITGSCPSLQEASQGLSIKVDEYDVDGWAEKISNLLAAPSELKRAELKIKKTFKPESPSDYYRSIISALDSEFNQSEFLPTNILKPGQELVFKKPQFSTNKIEEIELNPAFMLPIMKDFGTAENYVPESPILTFGDWHASESWGRWAKFPGSTISLSFERISDSATYYMCVLLNSAPKLDKHDLRIAVNGYVINTCRLESQPKTVLFKLPSRLLKLKNNLITFFYNDKEVNVEELRKIDARLLSFGIYSMMILDASDNKNIPIFLELMGRKN